MKLRYQILIGIGLAFLQGIISSFTGSILIPNIILILTIVGVFSTENPIEWVVIGWTATILRDVSLGLYFGFGGISIILVVLFTIFLSKFLSNENLIGVAVSIFLGTLVYNVIFWFMGFLVRSPFSFIVMLEHWGVKLPLGIIFGLVAYIYLTRSLRERHRKERLKKYL
ncbi:hypothetical protein ACGCUQ_01135 [Eubacteriales bacterium KG127]